MDFTSEPLIRSSVTIMRTSLPFLMDMDRIHHHDVVTLIDHEENLSLH